MLRNDAFLRQLEQLAEIVTAYREGEASGERVERQLEVATGLTMEVLATLAPSDLVPPLDDPRVRRARALGIADALYALGYTDTSFRLVEVAAGWRADDELEAEHWARCGRKVWVWVGDRMACVRTLPRSLDLLPSEGRGWTGWSPSQGPGSLLSIGR